MSPVVRPLQIRMPLFTFRENLHPLHLPHPSKSSRWRSLVTARLWNRVRFRTHFPSPPTATALHDPRVVTPIATHLCPRCIRFTPTEALYIRSDCCSPVLVRPCASAPDCCLVVSGAVVADCNTCPSACSNHSFFILEPFASICTRRTMLPFIAPVQLPHACK